MWKATRPQNEPFSFDDAATEVIEGANVGLSVLELPEFPAFKQLELSDRLAVEALTRRHRPYSDFVFSSLWSWDTHGETRISQFGNNLIVRLADYLTRRPFYSFIGLERVDEVALALLRQSDEEGLDPSLRLIPEFVAAALPRDAFHIAEEVDHADYVFSTQQWSTYDDSRFESRRNEIRKFKKRHPDAQGVLLDLTSARDRQQITDLFDLWLLQRRNREIPGKQFEHAAFTRCLAGLHSKMIATGVRLKDQLIAFSLNEDVGDGWAVGHFEKYDTINFRWVTAFLRQHTAGVLAARGISRWNFEQDLGIAGLRTNKISYHPIEYLRKCSVSVTNER